MVFKEWSMHIDKRLFQVMYTVDGCVFKEHVRGVCLSAGREIYRSSNVYWMRVTTVIRLLSPWIIRVMMFKQLLDLFEEKPYLFESATTTVISDDTHVLVYGMIWKFLFKIVHLRIDRSSPRTKRGERSPVSQGMAGIGTLLSVSGLVLQLQKVDRCTRRAESTANWYRPQFCVAEDVHTAPKSVH